MARIKWDEGGKRFYETGVKRGVLYVKDAETNKYGKGVAWNGLTSISESPSGAEETALYADDIKYLSLRSVEELGLSIEAYTYPDEWAECDGTVAIGGGLMLGQQSRKYFGLSYRTQVGNDANSDFGYKVHLIYNCSAAPSERSYQTINDSPEAISFSWEVKTTTESLGSDAYKDASSVTIDTTKLTGGKENAKLACLEKALYGQTKEAKSVKYEAQSAVEGRTYYASAANAMSASSPVTNPVEGQTYYYVEGEDTNPTLPDLKDVIALFNGDMAEETFEATYCTAG